MKVMQINCTCSVGSTGRIAVDIAKLLKSNGDSCKIAYSRGFAPDGIDTFRVGNKYNMMAHGMLSRFTDRQGFYSTGATKALISEIVRYNPDIIHLHNIHGYYLNIRVLFNFLHSFDRPVIWTLHDCWPFTGHCAYFDYVGCDKWKTGCSHCPQKKEYPSSLLKDNSFENYKTKKTLFKGIQKLTIVTPSEWLAKLIEESFLNEYKTVVINNGIDTGVFRPTKSDFRHKYNLENKKIILGVASVWEKRKGLRDFIKLSEILDDSFKIVLLGLNEEQIKTVPENIIGITRTNNVKELAELYTASDIFVNTTYEDNYPTVNLEALACGTPVITYKTGGSPESLDESCGIVVECGDVMTLAEEIKNFDYEKYSADNCLARSEGFNKNDRFKSYISLYKELCR